MFRVLAAVSSWLAICSLAAGETPAPQSRASITVECAGTPTLAEMAKAAGATPERQRVRSPRLPSAAPEPFDLADVKPIEPEPRPAPGATRPLMLRGPGCPGPGLFLLSGSAGFQALDDDLSGSAPFTMGSAGPSQVMTTLRGRTRVQDTSGIVLTTISTRSFWTGAFPSANAVESPTVHFDVLSGRWIFTVVEYSLNSAAVLLAVSQTMDALGPWNLYRIDSDPNDQTFIYDAKLGVNGQWIAISANVYENSSGTFQGSDMWVVDKATVLTPGSPLSVTRMGVGFDLAGGLSSNTLQPARCLDGTSDPELYIVDGPYEHSTTHETAYRFSRIIGSPGSPAWEVVPGSPIAAATGLFPSQQAFTRVCPPAMQAGTPQTVNASDPRVQSVVWRNGSMWFVHHAGLPATPPMGIPAPDRVAIIWNNVTPTLAPAPTLQSGTVDRGPNTWAIYPSIAVNCRNDVLIGYTASDPSMYPSAHLAFRHSGTPMGAMDAIDIISQAGLAPYTNPTPGATAAWGPHSATVCDPNGTDVWTLQAYADIPAPSDRWAVQWTRLQNIHCVAPTFFTHPAPLTRCPNQTAIFSAGFSSTIPPTGVQWRLNGNALSNDARHSGVNTSTLTVTGLTAGDAGAYTLTVSHQCGSSTSNAAILTMNPAAPTSAANVTFGSTNLCDRVTIQWIAVPNTTTYAVKRATTDNTAAASTIATIAAPAGSYDDVNAAAGTTYYYWVETSNACGTAAISGPGRSGRRLPAAPYPTNVFLTPSCSGVQLTWNSSADAASYAIWRNSSASFSGATLITTVPYTTQVYFDGTAPVGTSYYFFVPSNACGDRPATGAYSTTVVGTAPASGVTASSQLPCRLATVSWTASSNATGYTIRRALTPDLAASTIVGTGPGPSYGDHSTVPGTTYYYWVVANRTGCPDGPAAGPASVVAKVPVEITLQPVDRYVVRNQPVAFKVAAMGTGPLTFQWYFDVFDQPVSGGGYIGANTDTLSVSQVGSVNDGDRFYCRVTGACGSVDSDVAILFVENSCRAVTTPTVMFNPTVCTGDSLRIHADTDDATYPLTYIWRRDGVVIPGANDYSIYIPSLTVDDAGAYTCEIGNGCTTGTVTTPANTLVVRTPPAFNTQPGPVFRCAGQSVAFSVSVTSSSTPTYQWRKDGVNISGATTTSYSIASVSPASAGTYDCVVTNNCGSSTSSPGVLTVGAGPTITTQPLGSTRCTPQPFSLLIAATGSAPITYQWRKNGVDIPGETGTTLIRATSTTADAGTYTCVVTNPCGSVTSIGAVMIIQQSTTISYAPISIGRCVGQSAVFQVQAWGQPPMTYQWRKNSVNIPGAGGSYTAGVLLNHSIPSVSLADGAIYDCLFSSPCGNTSSGGATLTVSTPYTFTQQPTAPSSICIGSPLTLTCTATSAGPVNYQWRKNGAQIPGATSSSLAFPSITAGDAGAYACDVSGACAGATSNFAFVTVVSAPPTITMQPVGGTRCLGQSISFTCTFAANSPVGATVQWRKNGTAIPGATGTFLNISPVTAASAGSYDCLISNICGGTATDAAVLMVCTADYNCSGAVSAQDIFDFLASYFANSPSADFNGSGSLSVQDVFDFLTAYFTGCA